MPWLPILLIAGVPGGVVALLILAGYASFWPAVIGIAAIVLVGVCVVMVWAHEVDTLARAIAQMESGTGVAGASVTMPALELEIFRLSRRLTNRASLAEQHRRADSQILDRLPDPVIVLTADRVPLRTNAAARASYANDIAAVLRQPGLRGAIDRAMAQNTVQTADLMLRAPVDRDVVAAVVPMDPPLADGGRLLLVLSDRSRERAVERMRADFVANVSHELRTPLTSLIGFIETLRGPAADDTEAQRRFLAIMAEQGERMKRLIDDLLGLSRIELNEHQPPQEQVDLRDVFTRLVAGLQPRFAERAVSLDMRISEDLPPIVADPDQMSQVLQNLLDNAVKYGRESGTVRLTAARAEPGQRWPARPGVVIVVADEGAGIPKEHLPRLTERFYRVDKGRSRAAGGTGLGLAIVKHIVNRHRGQLLIESEVDVGTTISVWLPVVQTTATAAEGD